MCKHYLQSLKECGFDQEKCVGYLKNYLSILSVWAVKAKPFILFRFKLILCNIYDITSY